jgi:hypothetical protein
MLPPRALGIIARARALTTMRRALNPSHLRAIAAFPIECVEHVGHRACQVHASGGRSARNRGIRVTKDC